MWRRARHAFEERHRQLRRRAREGVETVLLATFLRDSEGLYVWGKSHQCGFFVRVFDATKPSEKAVYKERLQIVEAHFYKLLTAGSTPPSPAGDPDDP
jgi:hypothetical protein